ncbi:MAG: hypothetical protein LBD45_07200 [Bacteroidales bacterium]|jgi:uncharacterized protein YbjQ (UPF0145 family)|nr:hypothetical protein [Bacteroidales bacterium]
MRCFKAIKIVSVIALLSGCATGSVIVTGNVRTAIDPGAVKIYLEPPAQYETIGIVEASSAVELSSQAAQDRVIAELKKRAAKIGANGIILTNIGNQSSTSAGFYDSSFFYAGVTETKNAQGKAIYVIQE